MAATTEKAHLDHSLEHGSIGSGDDKSHGKEVEVILDDNAHSAAARGHLATDRYFVTSITIPLITTY